MLKHISFAFFFVSLIAAVVLFGGRPGYYPNVSVEVPGELDLFFLRDAYPEQYSCEASAVSMAAAIQATCSNCRVKEQGCITRLKPQMQQFLSSDAIDAPSTRTKGGVVIYNSSDPAVGLAACREADRQTALQGEFRARCYPPGASRPMQEVGPILKAMSAWLVGLFGCLATGFACYLIIRYESLHSRWSGDPLTGPQKFHSVPTPRVGGLCLMLGLFVAHIAAFNLERPLQDQYGYLLLAALPAFLVGITEDVTKQVGVQTRLAITMVAASCGAWLMNGIISRIDVPLIDELLRWTPLAVAFTVFSVAGVANAMNIIDGYNGLAAGYGLIVLLALGYVSFQVGDGFLVLACTGMIGALCGFLAFNYPKGKIFLGDSGAYTLGFWLAEISVLLVTRHSDVSPWFPVALLIYPVFETLFSIYRRKLVRGSSPGHPDRLHMHQMIYMRLVRGFLGRTDRDLLTRRNSLVAPYIWGVAVLLVVSAVSAWRHTLLLCLIICSFCACYVRVYSQVVHWRTPSWLIVRERIKG